MFFYSTGIDIGAIDLINIQMFSRRVLSLSDYRKTLADYLHNKMVSVAPNLAALIGEQVVLNPLVGKLTS